LLERIKTITTTKFIRLKYNDAIELLQKTTLSKPALFGDDLSAEMENYLTDYFNGPVFVTHWPIAIKSFYMKQCSSGLCENFDLLMPYKVGELIGGSMREDDLEKLLDVMKVKGVSPEPLQFYLDLRKFGSIPHGGFGLGLDRMCMMFTGMESIKDVVAFPVFYKNCRM
jgi:asparaginyl-tRNA synthetase